jgi:hypothetical protein
MILINNYLPTMMTGSEPNYIEHLDKLSALIEKYEDTHQYSYCGRFEWQYSFFYCVLIGWNVGFFPF